MSNKKYKCSCCILLQKVFLFRPLCHVLFYWESHAGGVQAESDNVIGNLGMIMSPTQWGVCIHISNSCRNEGTQTDQEHLSQTGFPFSLLH